MWGLLGHATCGPGSPHTLQASPGRASHPSCHHEFEGRSDLDLGLGLVLDCWKLLGWGRSLGRRKEEPKARWRENLGEVEESRGRGQEELEEPRGRGQLQGPEDASPHMAPGTQRL